VSRHTIKYETINAINCKKHADLINTKHTTLIQIGPYTYINSTNSLLNYNWCCREILNINYKLIVKAVFASYNYHTNKFFSSTVFLQNCDPKQLKCIVDNQIIVWNDDVYDQCSLIQGRTVKAQQRGFDIVSTEGQFAVTLTGKTDTLCKLRLQTTHEGTYVLVTIDPHQPFHNLSNTLQMAYQISNLFLTVAYVPRQLQHIIHTRFVENWIAICNLQRTNFYQLRQMAATQQASVALRALLQTDDIVADIRGDLLQITSCLNISTYYLRNETACYNNVPISFIINNHTITNAFLVNNHLREIVYNSIPVTCNRITQSYYKTSNSTYIRWTGNSFDEANSLSITHFQSAIAFKNSDDFHLSYDKVFDEDKNLVYKLMDLEGVSSKMKAMTELLVAISSDSDISLEQIKSFANQLELSTEHVINSTYNTVKSFLPSTRFFIFALLLLL
jgi:hypothetical protein